MALTLQVMPELLEKVSKHLLRHEKGEDEQVAFFFSAPYEGDGVLRLTDVYLVPREEFDFQSGYHVSLSDQVRQRIIRRAWEAGSCLVECHSHPSRGQVALSGSDLKGLDDWVPHLWWRLKGRPYAALVFGYESFDGVAWVASPDDPEPVGRLSVVGGQDQLPTRLTISRLRAVGWSNG